MNPKIEINSISFTKLKNDQPFSKYNIEAALDEVESLESEVVLKYRLNLLSNPTNTKITVEGLARIYGQEHEISRQLGPDEKNIPMVLNFIYQEVFPLFFIMSKSMQIPCPAYKLSQMSSSAQVEKNPQIPQEPKETSIEDMPSETPELDEQIEVVTPTTEPVLEHPL